MYKAKHLPKFHLPHIPPAHPASQFLLPALPFSPPNFSKNLTPQKSRFHNDFHEPEDLFFDLSFFSFFLVLFLSLLSLSFFL